MIIVIMVMIIYQLILNSQLHQARFRHFIYIYYFNLHNNSEGQTSWNVKSSGPQKASLQTSGGDGIPLEVFQILKDDAVKVLHSMPANLKTQQWPQDWKRSVFIPIPKKGNAKQYIQTTTAFISHVSKVMLKILQARLQQYVNQELPDVQAGFRKGRGTRSNCQHQLNPRKS